MAKKLKIKKSRRLAGKMLLASAAGNLQMFKEYMVQVGFFDGKENKDIWETLSKVQSNIRQIRKSLGKQEEKPVNAGEVEQGYAGSNESGGSKKGGSRS